LAGAEKKTGSSSAGLRLLSLVAALTPAPAHAGAWIAPIDGQEIWTTLVGERDELAFYEGASYWETPANERTSAVFSTWYEQNYETEDGWRAEAVLGAKRTLFRDDNMVMAAQAGALWNSHPSDGCGEGGAELRFLGGQSYGNGAFINLEAATRAFEGGCGGERIDVTAGSRFAGNWLAMGQVFVDSPHEGEETVKAQISLVRFGDEGRGIQVGLRARVDDGVQEPALVIGFWGPAND
jgi:hypothetical protein